MVPGIKTNFGHHIPNSVPRCSQRAPWVLGITRVPAEPLRAVQRETALIAEQHLPPPPRPSNPPSSAHNTNALNGSLPSKPRRPASSSSISLALRPELAESSGRLPSEHTYCTVHGKCTAQFSHVAESNAPTYLPIYGVPLLTRTTNHRSAIEYP